MVTLSNQNITRQVIAFVPAVVTMTLMANNLKKIRKLKKLSVWKLEEMTGISAQQINRLEKGERRFNTDNLGLLADALGCKPEDIISSGKKIQVVGYLRDGIFSRHNEGEMLETIEAPLDVDADTLEAFRIEDNSAGAIVFKDWHIIVNKDHTFIEEECIDRICQVKLRGGDTILRKVKKGYSPGRYNLQSYTPGDEDINDAELEWCVKMKYSMQP